MPAGFFNSFRIAVIALVAILPIYPAQRWISVTTSHFEMYTTNGAKQAMESLQGFEQVRYFFLQNSKNKQAPEGRVRIIAFSSEKEYAPYRLNAGNFAYYTQSRQRDYIVMQDINAEHRDAAVHEYTHLIIRHLKLEFPLWFEEGTADLYSSLEPRGDKAMVGRPLAGHLITLMNQQWMDWNVLFNVDHNSPFYNERDKMSIFYAQSWALIHMLNLSPAYAPAFPKFSAAMANGTAAADAFRDIYQKSVPQIAKDVQNYIRQATVKAAIFDVKLSKTDLDPQVSNLSPFESELALADLLSTRPQTAPEAQRRLLALEAEAPGNAQVEESLGYLVWQQDNVPEAMKHFKLAIDGGSKSPEMLFQYAQMLRSKNAPTAEVMPLLQRSLDMQPQNLDVRFALAEVELEASHNGEALATLSVIHNVSPDQAFHLFALMAAIRTRLRDFDNAREDGRSALKYAKTPSETAQIDQLMRFIDSSTKPMVAAAATQTQAQESPSLEAPDRPTIRRTDYMPRVQGTTKTFECVHGGFRLHIEADGKEKVFAMPPDPKNIVIRNVEGGYLEWNCGPLKPQSVTVVYGPATQDKTDGVVSELIF